MTRSRGRNAGTGAVAGLLLAAGAGRRAGGPKALRRDPDGTPWVVTAARSLTAAGCDPVVVVAGCRSDEVAALLAPEPVRVVVADRWADGLSASLTTGLDAVVDERATAVLVHLVDLPDVGAAVAQRVLRAAPVTPATLRRAAYGPRPGHPVLIGSDHLPGIAADLTGDRGAGHYLRDHDCDLVPCEDLATGIDVDEPAAVR